MTLRDMYQPGRNLEERTARFAKAIRDFVKTLPFGQSNHEDIKQLVRSSGSIGANYIEANESLGKKDFLMHVRIARKEAKESMYWLGLIDAGQDRAVEKTRQALRQESYELRLIISKIILNAEKNNE